MIGKPIPLKRQRNEIDNSRKRQRLLPPSTYRHYKPENWEIYKTFGTWTGNKDFDTPFGPVRARKFRGAPFITSDKSYYENDSETLLSYKQYFDAFEALKRKKTITDFDKKIAEALLYLKLDFFEEDAHSIRAAAMIFSTVYLAEEWRKQGAQKIFRAYLRMCIDGSVEFSFKAFKEYFLFVKKADEGRKQVARISAVQKKEKSVADLMMLSEYDATLSGYISEDEDDEHAYDSDDEIRERKKLKKIRIYPTEHVY